MAACSKPMVMAKCGLTGTARLSSSSMVGDAPPMRTLTPTKLSWGTGTRNATTFGKYWNPDLSPPRSEHHLPSVSRPSHSFCCVQKGLGLAWRRTTVEIGFLDWEGARSAPSPTMKLMILVIVTAACLCSTLVIS